MKWDWAEAFSVAWTPFHFVAKAAGVRAGWLNGCLGGLACSERSSAGSLPLPSSRSCEGRPVGRLALEGVYASTEEQSHT